MQRLFHVLMVPLPLFKDLLKVFAELWDLLFPFCVAPSETACLSDSSAMDLGRLSFLGMVAR